MQHYSDAVLLSLGIGVLMPPMMTAGRTSVVVMSPYDASDLTKEQRHSSVTPQSAMRKENILARNETSLASCVIAAQTSFY